MIKEKQMKPAGQAMIGLAKKTGTWTALVDVQNSVIPPDLQKALDTNKVASKISTLSPLRPKGLFLSGY